MLSIFKVYSGSWETEVVAESATEAALIGTREKYIELGRKFNIGFCIITEKKETNLKELFCPVAIFQDLGYFNLSREIAKTFETLQP